MLKKAHFLEKTVKIASASGALAPNPRLSPEAGVPLPDPRVVTTAIDSYIKCSALASPAVSHLFSLQTL